MNEIHKVEYNGMLVLTTKQIAEAYEVEPKKITDNFNNNKYRYVEGKHYICLEGERLKEFKDETENFGFDKKLNKLYLWTKKGAFLHAKSLNTDMAWEVYDRLVDDYFDRRENFTSSDVLGKENEKFLMCLQGVKVVADDLRVAQSSRLLMYNGVFKEFGLPTSFLPHYEDNWNRERCSATELLNRNNCGMSTMKFNELLIGSGFLEIKERKSSKGSLKPYKSLTESGLKYGVNLISNKNQKETQPHYYADTFMDLYERVTGVRKEQSWEQIIT